jgi:ubiquinone/menaquinone biosynthesis C-methylase UbiE
MNTDDNQERFSGDFGKNYDIFHEAVPWHEEFQDSIVKVLKDAFIGKNDITLLEAGFGTGLTTKKVLEQLPEAHITAIDNVALMEEKTKEYIPDDMLKNTHFVIGDLLEELQKIATGSIDGFYSGYVLHNIEKETRANIFNEIYRVLKPGGVFVNGDRIAHDDIEEEKVALANAIDNCGVFIKKYNNADFYLEWVRHYLRDEEPDLIFHQSEQVRLLTDLHFNSIQYTFQKGLEATCSAIK